MTTFGIRSGAPPASGPRRSATIGGHLTQTRWCKKLEANFCLAAGLAYSLPPSLFRAIQSTWRRVGRVTQNSQVYTNEFCATSWLKITVEIDIAFHSVGLSPNSFTAQDGKGDIHNLTTWLAIHPKISQKHRNLWDLGSRLMFGLFTVMFGLFTVKFGPFTFPSRSHHAHPEMKT